MRRNHILEVPKGLWLKNKGRSPLCKYPQGKSHRDDITVMAPFQGFISTMLFNGLTPIVEDVLPSGLLSKMEKENHYNVESGYRQD